KEQARERVYGMPFADWKAQHQAEATPEQLAAFAEAQRKHG
ncbi:deoxycytidine triphosphate deaminase, partial [Xanthomonas sontii]